MKKQEPGIWRVETPEESGSKLGVSTTLDAALFIFNTVTLDSHFSRFKTPVVLLSCEELAEVPCGPQVPEGLKSYFLTRAL